MMEMRCSRENFQAIIPRVQMPATLQIPEIEITHHCSDEYNNNNTSLQGSTSLEAAILQPPNCVLKPRGSKELNCEHHSIPAIEITHHCNDEYKNTNTSQAHHESTSLGAASMQPLPSCVPRGSTNCKHRRSSSSSDYNDGCDKKCLSLLLPLEVELNVLGVVEQDVIDKGQYARRKRNSVPDIKHRLPPPQKERPRSYSSRADLRSNDFEKAQINSFTMPINTRSSTLCSTEL